MHKWLCKKIGEWANSRLGEFKAVYSTIFSQLYLLLVPPPCHKYKLNGVFLRWNGFLLFHGIQAHYNKVQTSSAYSNMTISLYKNKVAAFRGMHVSPAKHSYAWLPRRYRTDGQTDAGQSDPYVPLCFAGDTTSNFLSMERCKANSNSLKQWKVCVLNKHLVLCNIKESLKLRMYMLNM